MGMKAGKRMAWTKAHAIRHPPVVIAVKQW